MSDFEVGQKASDWRESWSQAGRRAALAVEETAAVSF